MELQLTPRDLTRSAYQKYNTIALYLPELSDFLTKYTDDIMMATKVTFYEPEVCSCILKER